MTWYLSVKTTADEHILDFRGKDEADAALEETLGAMARAVPISPQPVKIAGRLVVVDGQITSANAYEGM